MDTSTDTDRNDRHRLLRAFNLSLGFVLLLVALFAAQQTHWDWRPLAVAPHAESPGLKWWIEHNPEEAAEFFQTIPLRRVGDCEEDVGRVAVFLASDDAAYVTAQTMWVDGGSGTVR